MDTKPIRVLYSFPHKIGSRGICYAAWEHVKALHEAGAYVTVCTGVLSKPFPEGIHVVTTLSRGIIRLPYRVFGRLWSCAIHDWLTSRILKKNSKKFDLVHGFALGSLRTLATAKEFGIPSVVERCNAHTRHAYQIVRNECVKLGIVMPNGHSHQFHAATLRREEAEYKMADYLFCPSLFVERTFINYGFAMSKLQRFQYGSNPQCVARPRENSTSSKGLTVLFAAGCAPRKGLHYALWAWLASSASNHGTLLIAGDFIPGYAESLSKELTHPSISVIGYRNDLAELMQRCDVLVLPSLEEGSALVTYDARAAGCVLLVSDASGAICEHGVNALIHQAGDVRSLTRHLTALDQDRNYLNKLREESIASIDEITWSMAGSRMLDAYRRMIFEHVQ